MKDFTSFLSIQMEEFIHYRKVASNWNGSYEENLQLFDSYVSRNYPDSYALSQDMTDGWCTKRPTEMNNSCRSRIYVVVSFLKYPKNVVVLALIFRKFPVRKGGHTFHMPLPTLNWPFFSMSVIPFRFIITVCPINSTR